MRVAPGVFLFCSSLFAAPASAQPGPRIGVVSGAMGSFAAIILKAHGQRFDSITAKTPGDSLKNYRAIFIDNLFRLQDLNGAAFKEFIAQGGVLVIINPKADGFSKTWAPYDIFIGEYTLEAKITDRKHPLFRGFTDDKLREFAESNGPFVGNCSFSEPAKEWRVLAKHAKKGKNAVIAEAAYEKGRVIVTCTTFVGYNAKPGPTRLGDNLIDYVLSLVRASP